MASQSLDTNRQSESARTGSALDTAALDAAVADLQGRAALLGRPAVGGTHRAAPGGPPEGGRGGRGDRGRRVRRARGLETDSWWARDLWGGLSPLANHMGALEEVLGRVAVGRDPLPVRAVHTCANGQVVVDVVPATRADHLMFAGWGLHGQVWMQPGITRRRSALARHGPTAVEASTPPALPWCWVPATSRSCRRRTCCTCCSGRGAWLR